MIRNFGNKIAKDINEVGFSKSLPRELHLRARVLLQIMWNTNRIEDLLMKGEPPRLRLHKLKGDRKDEYAINIQNGTPWRITFKFIDGEFVDVKIEDYH